MAPENTLTHGPICKKCHQPMEMEGHFAWCESCDSAKNQTAHDLVAEMHSFLATDQFMGVKLKPTDLDWMTKAKAYLEEMK